MIKFSVASRRRSPRLLSLPRTLLAPCSVFAKKSFAFSFLMPLSVLFILRDSRRATFSLIYDSCACNRFDSLLSTSFASLFSFAAPDRTRRRRIPSLYRVRIERGRQIVQVLSIFKKNPSCENIPARIHADTHARTHTHTQCRRDERETERER